MSFMCLSEIRSLFASIGSLLIHTPSSVILTSKRSRDLNPQYGDRTRGVYE